jgi:hypothetical protein
MTNASLQVRVSEFSFNTTLAYLAALWTGEAEAWTETVYPMRKVAQATGLAK